MPDGAFSYGIFQRDEGVRNVIDQRVRAISTMLCSQSYLASADMW